MKHLAWIAAALLSVNAFAHHGWSWAEEDQTELTGTIESISMSPPHPVLKVKAADGIWQVDLGNPSQTERSGFTGGFREGRRPDRRARQPFAGEGQEAHEGRAHHRGRAAVRHVPRAHQEELSEVLEVIGRVAGRDLAAAVGDCLSIRQCRAHPGVGGVARRHSAARPAAARIVPAVSHRVAQTLPRALRRRRVWASPC